MNDPPHARREIVRETLKLLESDGMEAVSLRRIAGQINSTTGKLYHYFADKDELLSAVVAESFLLFDRALQPVTAIADPVEQLHFVVDAYLRFAHEHPELYRVMFDARVARRPLAAAALDAIDPEADGARDRSFGRLIEVIKKGVDAGVFCTTPFDGASFLWITVHGLVELQRTGWMNGPNGETPPTVEAFLSQVTPLMIRALSGDRPAPIHNLPPS